MSKEKVAVRTIAEFRSNHDDRVKIPRQIEAALASMRKEGAEHWEYEADFIRRAGIHGMQLIKYRSLFEDHVVTVPSSHGKAPRRVWFGDKKVAAKVREE